MNILVNGASGFIGRALVESLSRHGCSGTATGRTPPKGMPGGWDSSSRAEALSTAGRGFDAVIHLEVMHHVARPTAADQLAFTAVNVDGVAQWLKWAAISGVPRCVYVSSVKAVRNTGAPAYENTDYEREDPYGRSKAAAEKLVREWADSDRHRIALILRFPPVYGPGNQANLAAFARQVMKGRPAYIGLGDTCKSVLGVANAVAAIEHALEIQQFGCEVFNVSDPHPVSVAEMAGAIADACDAPPPRGVPRAAAMVAACVGDLIGRISGREFVMTSRRLKGLTQDAVFPPEKFFATGFVPVQNTYDGLSEMARWLRSSGG